MHMICQGRSVVGLLIITNYSERESQVQIISNINIITKTVSNINIITKMINNINAITKTVSNINTITKTSVHFRSIRL